MLGSRRSRLSTWLPFFLPLSPCEKEGALFPLVFLSLEEENPTELNENLFEKRKTKLKVEQQEQEHERKTIRLRCGSKNPTAQEAVVNLHNELYISANLQGAFSKIYIYYFGNILEYIVRVRTQVQ